MHFYKVSIDSSLVTGDCATLCTAGVRRVWVCFRGMTLHSFIFSYFESVERQRCWILTPYLHWREEAPYWKRHCSSASYTCPGDTVGYRKSRFRGSLSRHVPRPELSKKQTYNRIVSYTKEAFYTLMMCSFYSAKTGRLNPLPSFVSGVFLTHLILPPTYHCRKLVKELKWHVINVDITHQHLLIKAREAQAHTFYQRRRRQAAVS